MTLPQGVPRSHNANRHPARATSDSFEPITDASMKYSTQLFGDEVVSLVHRHPAGTPLFIYAPFEAVHGASSCYVAGLPPDCKRPDRDELQAPQRFIHQQGHIKHPDRRTFAGMLGALDEAVGNITAALQARHFQHALIDAELMQFGPSIDFD